MIIRGWPQYQRPDVISGDEVCRELRIPAPLLRHVTGALLELTNPQMWAADSWAEAEEVARTIEEAIYRFIESDGCMPVGATIPYAGATAPDGWLMCDGAQYARTDYPLLYAALSSAFIVDADNFVTPNLDGRFIAGAGSTYPVGDTGGADSVTLTVDEMPAHTHTYDKPTFNVDVETVGVPDPTGVGEPQIPTSTTSTGGGNPHENRPPFTAMTMIIKAR